MLAAQLVQSGVDRRDVLGGSGMMQKPAVALYRRVKNVIEVMQASIGVLMRKPLV
jgi:hypothetical protein